MDYKLLRCISKCQNRFHQKKIAKINFQASQQAKKTRIHSYLLQQQFNINQNLADSNILIISYQQLLMLSFAYSCFGYHHPKQTFQDSLAAFYKLNWVSPNHQVIANILGVLKSQEKIYKHQQNHKLLLQAIQAHEHRQEPSFKLKSLYILDRAIDEFVYINFYQTYNKLTFHVEIKDVFRSSKNLTKNKSQIENIITNYYQYLLVKAQVFYSSEIVISVKDKQTLKSLSLLRMFTELQNIQRILQKIWALTDCCHQLPAHYLQQGLIKEILIWILRSVLHFIRIQCQLFQIIPTKIDSMNKIDLQQLITHLKFYNEDIVCNFLKFLKNNNHIQAFRQIGCNEVSGVDTHLIEVLTDYVYLLQKCQKTYHSDQNILLNTNFNIFLEKKQTKNIYKIFIQATFSNTKMVIMIISFLSKKKLRQMTRIFKFNNLFSQAVHLKHIVRLNLQEHQTNQQVQKQKMKKRKKNMQHIEQ